MEEIWKPIKGYEERYSISNLGNVKSKDRLLKPTNRGVGYLSVCLCKNNIKKTQDIHRLVCSHFIGDVDNLTVNHKDGNKQNNTLENLEIVTYAENNSHAVATGLNVHYTRKVQQVSIDSDDVLNEFESIKDAEKATGVSNKHISACCRGSRKQTGGFKWQYTDYNPSITEDIEGFDIPDYPNYKFTNCGNVYSKRQKQLLAPKIHQNGLRSVKLCNSAGRRDFYLHVLQSMTNNTI